MGGRGTFQVKEAIGAKWLEPANKRYTLRQREGWCGWNSGSRGRENGWRWMFCQIGKAKGVWAFNWAIIFSKVCHEFWGRKRKEYDPSSLQHEPSGPNAALFLHLVASSASGRTRHSLRIFMKEASFLNKLHFFQSIVCSKSLALSF